MAKKKSVVLRPCISQSDMRQYMTLRQDRLRIEGEARTVKRQEETLETKIRGQIDSGCPVEEGTFKATLVPGGRYPSWKQAFIDRCGIEAANEVEANTPNKIKLEVSVADTVSIGMKHTA